MLSKTITVETSSEATESEQARAMALAIKALLLSESDEVKVLAITMVFAGLDTEVQTRIRAMLALVSELKAQTRTLQPPSR